MSEAPLSPRRNDDKYHPKLMLSTTLVTLGYEEYDSKYRVVRIESKKGRPYLSCVTIPQGKFYGEPEGNILCAEISAAFEAMRFLARSRQFNDAIREHKEVTDSLTRRVNDVLEKYKPRPRVIYSATVKMVKDNDTPRSRNSRRLSTGDLGIIMPDTKMKNLENFIEEEEEKEET
jgi:hypothetical protein